MTTAVQHIESSYDVLSAHVITVVKKYLASAQANKDREPNVYQLVLEEIEAPLFRTVMEQTRYNQSKAAKVLGLSRGTLRTKLKQYFDDEFIGTREG